MQRRFCADPPPFLETPFGSLWCLWMLSQMMWTSCAYLASRPSCFLHSFTQLSLWHPYKCRQSQFSAPNKNLGAISNLLLPLTSITYKAGENVKQELQALIYPACSACLAFGLFSCAIIRFGRITSFILLLRYTTRLTPAQACIAARSDNDSYSVRLPVSLPARL